MPKLTKPVVDAAKPKLSPYSIWDNQVIGFGLVVQPSGTKSFCFQYRTPEGKRKRIVIGKFGTLGGLTVQEARDIADGHYVKVKQGGDPLADKVNIKKALTVGALLDSYLASAKFAEKAEATQSTDRGRVERHLKPLLGNAIANKLTADMIRTAYADIKSGKTATKVRTGPRGVARVTGGEGAARMAIRLLKSAFSWAISESLITNNSTVLVKISKDGKRDIVLSQDDYTALFSAIDKLEADLAINPVAADAIRVIALTGARRNEIAGLRWRHVNLKKGIATLGNTEHKAGKKTGDTRTIGLPTAAQAIISDQPEGEPDDYVFPPSSGGNPISLSKTWRKIREKAGFRDEVVMHSLRHSLATSMAMNGIEAAHIMAVMGHKNLATSQKYIHIAKDKRAEMAEKAAAGISAAMTGSPAAEVISLKDKKN